MTEIRVEFPIEDNVPIPVRRSWSSIPIEQLKVGQSIQFPLEKRASVQTVASRAAKETGRKFTVRKVNDSEARVWRTE
jgi:hypothetical protein